MTEESVRAMEMPIPEDLLSELKGRTGKFIITGGRHLRYNSADQEALIEIFKPVFERLSTLQATVTRLERALDNTVETLNDLRDDEGSSRSYSRSYFSCNQIETARIQIEARICNHDIRLPHECKECLDIFSDEFREQEKFASRTDQESKPSKEGQYWAIVGFYGKEIIGVCTDKQDVLAEEPHATFIAISKEDFDSFEDWNAQKRDQVKATRTPQADKEEKK